MDKNIGKMIAFKVQSRVTQSELNKFCREFYGYTDRSNKGKYVYNRKGFLSDVPHINPIRSLLIVKRDDADEIISFLKKYGAKVFVRDIILERPDVKKLGGDKDEIH